MRQEDGARLRSGGQFVGGATRGEGTLRPLTPTLSRREREFVLVCFEAQEHDEPPPGQAPSPGGLRSREAKGLG